MLQAVGHETDTCIERSTHCACEVLLDILFSGKERPLEDDRNLILLSVNRETQESY